MTRVPDCWEAERDDPSYTLRILRWSRRYRVSLRIATCRSVGVPSVGPSDLAVVLLIEAGPIIETARIRARFVGQVRAKNWRRCLSATIMPPSAISAMPANVAPSGMSVQIT